MHFTSETSFYLEYGVIFVLYFANQLIITGHESV